MPIFDGSRWDRVRRAGWSGRAARGRVEVFAGACLWALPLPSPTVFFEEGTLTLGARVGTRGMGDDVVMLEVTVRLSDTEADALLVVWPGRVAEGHRRAALRRLAGGVR